MGNEEEGKWYDVYHDLAVLLAKTNGEKLYSSCIKDDDFLDKHNWAKDLKDKHIRNKRTGEDFKVSSFDPMQIFVSFNGFGMKNENRIEKINIYFRLLGSDKKYKKIDFKGCPSPMIIALISTRNPKSQEELWGAFHEIMKDGQDAVIKFEDIQDWHGISIESFTVLLFWIDSRNFLPLDKNTLSLFETNNATVSYDNWEKYKEQLIKKDTDIYQVIAKMAWNCNDEPVKYKDKLDDFGIKKCPNKSLKIIAIKPLKGCNKDFLKGLKEEQVYLFDKAYTINNGTIEYHKEKDIQLFNQDNLQININAIVGKNGTGKSTLIELLLVMIHNLNAVEPSLVLGLKVELIFEALHIYKVKVDNDTIEFFEYEDERKKWREVEKSQNKKFFYNILVNYSIHSLDSSGKNSWIKSHFNKKLDKGITIEPFRTDGNINIHEENKRVRNRLIRFLLKIKSDDIEYDFRELTKEYRAVKLTTSTSKRKYKATETIEKKKVYSIDDLSMEIQNRQDKLSSIEDNYFEDIILSNGTTELKLSNLSSGEKQKIYSINSIVYHIEEINREKKYKHINLILDEIELYFHPELQRTYIGDIISAIKNIGTDYILGINITFITHSPFILSDIPESKILFLGKESDDIDAKTVSKENTVKTFGANIHNLLNSSFFMENGLMGEFARKRIKKIVKQLNDHKEKKIITETEQQDIKKVIQAIGEPFLNQKLWNMYQSLFNDIDAEEKRLNEEIDRIKKKIKGLKE